MNTTSDSNNHLKKVQLIQERIRELYARKIPFKVYHGSTNSTRVLSFKQSNTVDTSSLTSILAVDVEKRSVIAESNVPMDKLVKSTLKHGLIPKVVTEFPGITVGGGYQGGAAETSSFKYGCFSQTLNWVEVILANGKLLRVSPDDHADLFYGMAGSYGTLGVTTAAEIQLIAAKQYVNVTHHPVHSFEEAVHVSEKYTHEDVDFIECLMFSEATGSVITGKLSDTVVGKPKRFTRPFDPWYYLYVEKTLKRTTVVQDSIPLKDYLFRYNRGAFWGGKQAFEHFGVKFTAFNRFVLDPLMRTRKLYQALQSSAAAQVYICQDIVLPSSTTASFLTYTSTHYRMFPTGFCPLLSEPKSPLQCNGLKEKMLFNVGVYGLRVENYDDFVKINRDIEQTTQALGGKKWFYAHSYYDKNDFWSIYDKSWYDKLRKKYKSDYLPNIYDKVIVTKRHKLNDRKAALKTLMGKTGVRIKK